MRRESKGFRMPLQVCALLLVLFVGQYYLFTQLGQTQAPETEVVQAPRRPATLHEQLKLEAEQRRRAARTNSATAIAKTPTQLRAAATSAPRPDAVKLIAAQPVAAAAPTAGLAPEEGSAAQYLRNTNARFIHKPREGTVVPPGTRAAREEEKKEKERLEQEAAEQAVLEAERAEAARVAAVEAERAEAARLEAERAAEAERKAQEEALAEQMAREQAEREALAAAQAPLGRRKRRGAIAAPPSRVLPMIWHSTAGPAAYFADLLSVVAAAREVSATVTLPRLPPAWDTGGDWPGVWEFVQPGEAWGVSDQSPGSFAAPEAFLSLDPSANGVADLEWYLGGQGLPCCPEEAPGSLGVALAEQTGAPAYSGVFPARTVKPLPAASFEGMQLVGAAQRVFSRFEGVFFDAAESRVLAIHFDPLLSPVSAAEAAAMAQRTMHLYKCETAFMFTSSLDPSDPRSDDVVDTFMEAMPQLNAAAVEDAGGDIWSWMFAELQLVADVDVFVGTAGSAATELIVARRAVVPSGPFVLRQQNRLDFGEQGVVTSNSRP